MSHYQTYINSQFASAEAFTRRNYEGHGVQLELNVQQFGTDVSLAKIALLIVESRRARQPWVLAVKPLLRQMWRTRYVTPRQMGRARPPSPLYSLGSNDLRCSKLLSGGYFHHMFGYIRLPTSDPCRCCFKAMRRGLWLRFLPARGLLREFKRHLLSALHRASQFHLLRTSSTVLLTGIRSTDLTWNIKRALKMV